MKIFIVKEHETLRYAAEELLKYLTMMESEITGDICVGSTGADGIALGLLEDFGLNADDVRDPMIDDVIDLRIKDLHGYIAGSNERSVLMGVYNFLKSAGCRWVRPGKNGEYIPTRKISAHSFTYRKKADYPFRGECSEGAISFEHVRDTVLWLPKVNMNLFMIQHIYPYNQMNRWYKHLENTRMPHEDLSYEACIKYVEKLKKIVKKCGLQLHFLGHDPLNEAIGIRYWKPGDTYNIPEKTKKAFALINGKREMFAHSPVFTQLCMSQEWIRNAVVDWLVDYLKQNPEVDFLHFWLADHSNNQCECEECVKKTPSDWYVMMLNALDERLTAEGNSAKIVFIMYVDTLWPPIEEKLHNPSRFVLVTACGPVMNKPFGERYNGGVPPWVRNKFALPARGLPMVRVFSDAWKSAFDGPRFIFDYVFYTFHYSDPGYMNLTRQLAASVKNFGETGFLGVMSCQTQRAFFPSGLPMSLMGEFLFDTSHDTQCLMECYMKDAFGKDYQLATEYLEEISKIFEASLSFDDSDVTFVNDGKTQTKKTGTKSIIGNTKGGDLVATVPDIVDAFSPMIERNLSIANDCRRESWKILAFHREYCKWLSKIYFALSRNNIEQANAYLDELMDYLSQIEPEIHPYFDLVIFKMKMEQMIAGK